VQDVGNQKQEETFRDAMKRAFAGELPSLTDYTMSSENGSYMNANSYIKLLNSNMDPDQLTKQVARAGPEGLRFLMHFLARQCQKYQVTLKSLHDISHEIELEAAAKRLFQVMLEVTHARYGTIYTMTQNTFQAYVTNWPEKRATAEPDIFAARAVARGDMINVINFRTSDYHTDRIEENYQHVDPDCVISAPYFGDGMKVTGFIELIGKKDGNPIFTTEDEFLVQALSSLTTILFNQITVKQSAQKKSNNIKSFLTTANSMPAEMDMGDLINVIMDTTRDLVNADRCALFLLDKEKNELWSKVAQGTGEIRFPADRGIAGHVVTTGEICNIMDAYEDPRFNRDFDMRTGYRTKTILCVPMMSPEGEIIGAVQAINKIPDGYVFNDDDIAQLTSFATLCNFSSHSGIYFAKV
jgi:transcriptional regulator with GAF, ATPase, and Fis domain